MGANSRRRAQSKATTYSGPALYHGGVPGLHVGDVLRSASELGAHFLYHSPHAVYDPGFVYAVTDVQVAGSYASRYLPPQGLPEPGDVYRVEPLGVEGTDPDYPPWPEVFRRMRRARVVEVVERGLSYSEEFQLEMKLRYIAWKGGGRAYRETGQINPSPFMLEIGVPAEWFGMLRPWMRVDDRTVDLDASLSYLHPRPPRLPDWDRAIRDVAALDVGHQIEVRKRRWRRDQWGCQECAATFPFTQAGAMDAAAHQLGERVLQVMTQVHRASTWPVRQLVQAAARARPARWGWFPAEALPAPVLPPLESLSR